jgi:hypothetical protein
MAERVHRRQDQTFLGKIMPIQNFRVIILDMGCMQENQVAPPIVQIMRTRTQILMGLLSVDQATALQRELIVDQATALQRELIVDQATALQSELIVDQATALQRELIVDQAIAHQRELIQIKSMRIVAVIPASTMTE